MKKIISNTLIITYAVIAIFVTICLLSFNKYRVSELGSLSLVIIDNRDWEPEFKKGDLLITDRSYKLEKGDKVFFYDVTEPNVVIKKGEIEEIQNYSGDEYTYTVTGNFVVKAENVLGSVDNIKQISKVGTILGVLESKWGFLALIVFPSLIAFLYEVSEVVIQLKQNLKKKEQ